MRCTIYKDFLNRRLSIYLHLTVTCPSVVAMPCSDKEREFMCVVRHFNFSLYHDMELICGGIVLLFST